MLKDLLVPLSNTAVHDVTMSVAMAFAVGGMTRTLFDLSIVSVLFLH